MLGSSLGSGGQNGGLNPLYQIGGPRSAQLALKAFLEIRVTAQLAISVSRAEYIQAAQKPQIDG